jgi:hypothetical protein
MSGNIVTKTIHNITPACRGRDRVRYIDVTESVTLRERDRGSRSTGRKGVSLEINLVLLSFMSSMRVSRSVIPCGEMVRVLFRHSW